MFYVLTIPGDTRNFLYIHRGHLCQGISVQGHGSGSPLSQCGVLRLDPRFWVCLEQNRCSLWIDNHVCYNDGWPVTLFHKTAVACSCFGLMGPFLSSMSFKLSLKSFCRGSACWQVWIYFVHISNDLVISNDSSLMAQGVWVHHGWTMASVTTSVLQSAFWEHSCAVERWDLEIGVRYTSCR